MQVRVTPDLARQLSDLAAGTGRSPDQLVEDALTGYLEDLVALRETLDTRYDDLKSGRVAPIDGEKAFRYAIHTSDRR
jgi:predicted transcriptional regulator